MVHGLDSRWGLGAAGSVAEWWLHFSEVVCFRGNRGLALPKEIQSAFVNAQGSSPEERRLHLQNSSWIQVCVTSWSCVPFSKAWKCVLLGSYLTFLKSKGMGRLDPCITPFPSPFPAFSTKRNIKKHFNVNAIGKVFCGISYLITLNNHFHSAPCPFSQTIPKGAQSPSMVTSPTV